MKSSIPITQHMSSFFREELMSARGFSRHTYKSYWVTLRFLNSFLVMKLKKPLHDIPTDNLDYKTIYDWILYEKEKRNWGESTWNTRLAAVKTFVRYLAREDVRYLDLAARVELISSQKVRSRESDFLTLEEFNSALKNIDSFKKIDVRDKLMFQVLFFSGARVEELTNLKLHDIVRINHCSVNIYLFGKGRKGRNVPLLETSTNSNLKKYMEQLLRHGTPSEYLFPGQRGLKMSKENVRRIVRKHFSNAVKGKHITPHSLRHSAAMNWLNNGMEIFYISILLGHEDIQTTTRYLRSTFKIKVDALVGAGQDKKISQLFDTDFNSNADFWEGLKIKV